MIIMNNQIAIDSCRYALYSPTLAWWPAEQSRAQQCQSPVIWLEWEREKSGEVRGRAAAAVAAAAARQIVKSRGVFRWTHTHTYIHLTPPATLALCSILYIALIAAKRYDTSSRMVCSFRKCLMWVSTAELSPANNTSLPYFSKLASTPPAHIYTSWLVTAINKQASNSSGECLSVKDIYFRLQLRGSHNNRASCSGSSSSR